MRFKANRHDLASYAIKEIPKIKVLWTQNEQHIIGIDITVGRRVNKKTETGR